MKQINLTILLALLMCLVGAKSFAHDIEVANDDGVTIYYNFINKNTELEVTYRGRSYDSYSNEYTGSVVIPETVTYNGSTYSVTSIGNVAFRDCRGLTSATIGNSVTSIGDNAFYDCSGLEKIVVDTGNTIYDSRENCNAIIRTNSNVMVVGCKNTNIPNSVTSIGSSAFSGCSGLTSVSIPNSVTSIDNSAFSSCSGLSSVTIGNGVTSIGNYAFENCSSLPSVTIPNSVTSIGDYAFYSCRGLTSVTIPNSVTSIGSYAFRFCSGLRKNAYPSNLSNPFSDGVSIAYPQECSIDENDVIYDAEKTKLFYAPISLASSYVIPNSVTTILNNAFYGCSTLTSINIPEAVTFIANSAFRDCTNLDTLTFNAIKCSTGGTVGYPVFPPSISSLTFGDKVTCIPAYFLYNGNRIENLVIPNSVTSIDSYAFYGCTGIAEVMLPDDIISIGLSAFGDSPVKVKRGTKSLLSLWQAGYEPYDLERGTKLLCPALTEVSSTQTSIIVKAVNLLYDEYTYYIVESNSYGLKETHGEEDVLSNLYPEISYYVYLYIAMGDMLNSDSTPLYTIKSISCTTKPISPTINTTSGASSVRAIGSYVEGDAQVTSQTMAIHKGNNESSSNLVVQTDGNIASLTGLNPYEQYTIVYSVTVTNSLGNSRIYKQTETITTPGLVFTTSQPKVVSMGNVIVAAETNLDDEETNVGFEWRRMDWTDDFASNTGAAYLYNGTMEGYIRNLNAEKLWKYRPYYLSNSGTYYYGDWVGLDPSNTSYFEPTVHTYATITIEGNAALVKGYALAGTDKVTVQGFKYWKDVAGARGMGDASNVPAGALTVEASGQVMTATLTGLDYGSTYHYVAFVTTSEGETFYGEEQVFSTEGDPTGIEGVHTDASEPVTIVARYNIRGERIATPQEGVNILLMSDGSTKKVWIRKR